MDPHDRERQYHLSAGQSVTGTSTHTIRTEDKGERTGMDGRFRERAVLWSEDV
jgi:hypothetical protein